MAFALGSFDAGNGTFPGLVLEEQEVIDASAVAATVRDLFDDWHAARQELEELAASDAVRIPLEHLRTLAPIEPRQIVQAGGNYHEHVLEAIVAARVEQGDDVDDAKAAASAALRRRAHEGEPYLYQGSVGAVCGPYDDIILPPRGEHHDWEIELAAVIGPEKEIAGYVIANDVSTRDLFFRPDMAEDLGGNLLADWLRSKMAPTFLPLGPWIVPAEFVSDPQDLRITLELNGKQMQDEPTSDMIFSVERLRAYAAEVLRLFPGDLLLTGSPASTGARYDRWLREGDVIEAGITGLGRQRNRIRQARTEQACGHISDRRDQG